MAGRPRKQQPTFVDSLDIYCETCTPQELESVALVTSMWARVRKADFSVRIEHKKPQAALPLTNGGKV